jgi:hypothetical protein
VLLQKPVTWLAAVVLGGKGLGGCAAVGLVVLRCHRWVCGHLHHDGVSHVQVCRIVMGLGLGGVQYPLVQHALHVFASVLNTLTFCWGNLAVKGASSKKKGCILDGVPLAHMSVMDVCQTPLPTCQSGRWCVMTADQLWKRSEV